MPLSPPISQQWGPDIRHVILTEAEAQAIRAAPGSDVGHELNPIDLASGDLVLPEQCASDPHHAAHKTTLQAKPRWEVTDGRLEELLANHQSQAAAILAIIPSSITTVRTTGYSTAGDGGGALYKRVASEPSHAGKFQSADGAWWELVIAGGEMLFEQFGGVADGNRTTLVGTDNYDAFQRALSMYSLAANQAGNASAQIVPRLKFGIGIYYFGQTLDIRHVVNIVGRSSGEFTRFGGTKFTFPINTTGMRFQYTNTSGATGPAGAVLTGAGGFFVEGITLHQTGTDKTAHGFHLRVTGTLRNCYSTACPGNAFHVAAHVGHATIEGNANNFVIDHCGAHDFKGNALWIEGKDANAGRTIAFTTQGTADLTVGCGIYDDSFLGCTHIGAQITGYGNCGVHKDGMLYALISNTPNIGGATTPGTNDRVWYPRALGVADPTRYPEWVALNPYIIQLPWWCSGGSLFIGTYVEDAMPGHGGLVLGGADATNFTVRLGPSTKVSEAPLMTKLGVGAHRSYVPGTPGYIANGSDVWAGIGTFVGSDHTRMNLLEHKRLIDGDASWEWTYGAGETIYGFLNAKPIWRISTPTTTAKFGRPLTPIPHVFTLTDFALRDPGNSNNWRIIGLRDAPPTASGEYARGERYFHANPSAGGVEGWVCTTGGALAPAWVSGTNYALGSYILSNGKYYRCTIDGGVSSTAAPAHASGAVTEADGFQWTFVTATAAVWKPFGTIGA